MENTNKHRKEKILGVINKAASDFIQIESNYNSMITLVPSQQLLEAQQFLDYK